MTRKTTNASLHSWTAAVSLFHDSISGPEDDKVNVNFLLKKIIKKNPQILIYYNKIGRIGLTSKFTSVLSILLTIAADICIWNSASI